MRNPLAAPLRILGGLFGRGRSPTASASKEVARYRQEKYDDEVGVRSQSGGNQLELTDGERIRALRLSRRLYYRNGLYGELVDLFAGWIVGDGVVVTHEDPAAAEYLKEVLEHPRNKFHERLPDRVTRWLIDGELPWTFLVPYRQQPERDASGRVTKEGTLAGEVFFGRADPLDIGDVRVDALDADCIRSIQVNPTNGTMLEAAISREPLPVAEPDNPPVDVKVGKSGGAAAAIHLWRLNPLGIRGVPLLSRILDTADVIGQVVRGTAEKVEKTNRFMWHGKYKPTNNEKKDLAFEAKLLKKFVEAEEGESLVTPDSVTVDAIAPDLKLAETKGAYDMAVDWNLGAYGVPRMWFSSGGDTNRATSVEQGSPIYRQIRKRQSEFVTNVLAVAAYVIYIGQLAGVLSEDVDPLGVSVTPAEPVNRDTMREAEQLSTLSNAMRDLRDQKAVSAEEVQRILRRAIEAMPMGEELDEEPPPLPEEPSPPPPPPAGQPPPAPGAKGEPPAPSENADGTPPPQEA